MEIATQNAFRIIFPRYSELMSPNSLKTSQDLENFVRQQLPQKVQMVRKLQVVFVAFLNQYTNLILKRPQLNNLIHGIVSKANQRSDKIFKELDLQVHKLDKNSLEDYFQELDMPKIREKFRSRLQEMNQLIQEKYINNHSLSRENQEQTAIRLFTLFQTYHFTKGDLATIASKYRMNQAILLDSINNKTSLPDIWSLFSLDSNFNNYINQIVSKRCRPSINKRDFFANKIKQVQRQKESSVGQNFNILLDSMLSKQGYRVNKELFSRLYQVLRILDDKQTKSAEDQQCKEIIQEVDMMKKEFNSLKNNSYYIDLMRGTFIDKYKMELNKLQNLYYLSNMEKYLQNVTDFLEKLITLQEKVIQNRRSYVSNLGALVQQKIEELIQTYQQKYQNTVSLESLLNSQFQALQNSLYGIVDQVVKKPVANSSTQNQERRAQKMRQNEERKERFERQRQQKQKMRQQQLEKRKIQDQRRKQEEKVRLQLKKAEEKQKYELQKKQREQKQRKRKQQMEQKQKMRKIKDEQERKKREADMKKKDQERLEKEALEKQARQKRQRQIKANKQQEEKKKEEERRKREEQKLLEEQKKKEKQAAEKKQREKQIEEQKKRQKDEQERKRNIKLEEQKKKRERQQQDRKKREKQEEQRKMRIKDEEQKRKRIQEDKRKKEQQELKKNAQEKKKKEEDQKKKKEQAEKKKKEEQAEKQRQRQRQRKKKQQQVQKERKRKQQQAQKERKRKQQQAQKERKKKQQAEKKKKAQQEEKQRKRRQQEQQRKRKEEKKKKQEEAERERKRIEEQRKKQQALKKEQAQKMQKKKEEDERKAREEKKRKQEQEARKLIEEEENRIASQNKIKNKSTSQVGGKSSGINYGEFDDLMDDDLEEINAANKKEVQKIADKKKDDQYVLDYEDDFDDYSPDKEEKDQGEEAEGEEGEEVIDTKQLIDYEHLKCMNDYLKGTSYARKNKLNLEVYNNFNHYLYIFEELIQNGKLFIFDTCNAQAILDYSKELANQPVNQQDLAITEETIIENIIQSYSKQSGSEQLDPQTCYIFPFSFPNKLNILLIEVYLIFSQSPPSSKFVVVFKEPLNSDDEQTVAQFQILLEAFMKVLQIQLQPIIQDYTINQQSKMVIETFEKQLPNLLTLFAMHYQHNFEMKIKIDQYTTQRFFYISHTIDPFYKLIENEDQKLDQFYGQLTEKYGQQGKEDIKIITMQAQANHQGFKQELAEGCHHIKQAFLSDEAKTFLVLIIVMVPVAEDSQIEGQEPHAEKLTVYFELTKQKPKPALNYFIVSKDQQHQSYISEDLIQCIFSDIDSNFETTVYTDYTRHNALQEYCDWSIALWPHLIKKRKMTPINAFRAMTLSMAPLYIAYKKMD